MAKFGVSSDLVRCSFCGKSQKEVVKLIAGPGVYICDECTHLCLDIIEEEAAALDAGSDAPGAAFDPAEVLAVSNRLQAGLGRPPTVSELAGELGWDEAQVTAVVRGPGESPSGGWTRGRTVDEWQVPPGEWQVLPRVRLGKMVQSDQMPLADALRTIHEQLAQLSEELARVVERSQRREDP